ncbi:MAG: lipopolysaccharide biosynthesis protein [Bacteroidales bacterium]|nr:lipopolysaccharide biosynthesis protein [Bacteroidales bacterium]
MEKTIRRKTTDGLIWNTLQKLLSKGLQLVFSILIARILLPEDYGLIAIANLFIALSDVLIDSGFAKALIRQNDKGEADYSTVFWFNLMASCTLYALLFAVAPLIAGYYEAEALTPIIRAISLSLIINAICGVQSLHMIVEMDFRSLAILETTAMAIGGIAGLLLAMHGAGVWALVAQTLVGCSLRTILIWIKGRWRPSRIFSGKILRSYFSFGSRLLLSEFANRLYGSIFTLTIGKRFSQAQLGYYGKADAFASTPSSIVSGPLSSVTFPAMAKIQDEKERMKESSVYMMGLTSLVVFPLFLGLAAVAEALVPALLTEKWNGMIPLLQLLPLAYLLGALQVIPQNILMILGDSSSILRIQLISKGLGLALLFPLAGISLEAVCLDIVGVAALSFALTLLSVRRKAGIRLREMLSSMLPSALISLAMAGVVLLCVRAIPAHAAGMLAGIASGIISYALLSLAANKKQLGLLKTIIQPYFTKSDSR